MLAPCSSSVSSSSSHRRAFSSAAAAASGSAPARRSASKLERDDPSLSGRDGNFVATVVGASSHVGRYVVGRLGHVGAQVVFPYRGEEKGIRHLKVTQEVGQMVPLQVPFEAFKLNRPENSFLEKSMEQSRVVVNLVGRTYETRNYNLTQANADTAQVVAEAAAKTGVERLIHLSAAGAAEDSPSQFLRAKWESEQRVLAAFPDATILRPTQIFGPEDRFINKFGFILSFTHKWLPLLMNPDAYIQPVSVRDVATAVMNAIADPHTRGKTYELGGPEVMRLREMIEDIVFFHAKADKGQIVCPPEAVQALAAKWLGKLQRVPLYTEDEVNYYKTDNIVQHGALTLTDLGVEKRLPLDDVAINLLRNYREPAQYFDTDHASARAQISEHHVKERLGGTR